MLKFLVREAKFFNNIPYQMVGFAYNSLQKFCAVLTQPHIQAEPESTKDEIALNE